MRTLEYSATAAAFNCVLFHGVVNVQKQVEVNEGITSHSTTLGHAKPRYAMPNHSTPKHNHRNILYIYIYTCITHTYTLYETIYLYIYIITCINAPPTMGRPDSVSPKAQYDETHWANLHKDSKRESWCLICRQAQADEKFQCARCLLSGKKQRFGREHFHPNDLKNCKQRGKWETLQCRQP